MPLPEAVSQFTARLGGTLEDLIARASSYVVPPGAPRVLVVPALPGTQLGERTEGGDVRTLWLDLGSIRSGRLIDLAYDGPRLEPLGVFDPVYLQMVLRLRLAGFDVATHPYDWRRPVRDLGEDLAARIRAEGREVHVVAHSFGGLVTRAAALVGAGNLGRVIMMGSPHHGTFSVVQGIRGNHWVLHGLSALDGRHTPAELAQRAFGSWPSVYAQLPSRMDPGDVDVFDPAAWPAGGLHPRPELLGQGRDAQAWLAGASGRFFVIAGYGTPTVDRVEVRDGIFHYFPSSDGDGFVSTRRARLEGVPAYYARAAHIGMPNHADVIDAVEDLLRDGATNRLPTAPPPGSPCAPFTEEDQPEPPFHGARGPDITLDDIRSAFDEAAGFVLPIPVT